MNEQASGVPDWRARIGRVGAWVSGTAIGDGPGELATFLERLGYGALWIGGGNPDRAAFARLDALLGATERLVVVTGITNVWAWAPADLAAQAGRLGSAYPDRFVLGIGVSHAPRVEALGLRYERPYAFMTSYLDALDAAGVPAPSRVLAALGPRMLALAAARAAGAHPYLTTPGHSRAARATLGPAPLLAPEQTVVLEGEPAAARARARAFLDRYLRLPNYAGNLLRSGWQRSDLEGGGSDRLVDALVVHGDAGALRAALRAHLDAGADHVCLQALGEGGGVDRRALEALAPARSAP